MAFLSRAAVLAILLLLSTYNNRIVGGKETGANEYPMMALVTYGHNPKNNFGGTIIDKRYVLTCAHAVRRGAANLFVVVGEHNILATNDSLATKGFIVESVLIHPEYDRQMHKYNDIAILRVKEDIVFSDRVGPVCLPFILQAKRFDFTGSTVTLLGWGELYYNGPRSTVLQEVDVSVMSEQACQAAYPSTTPGHICTYAPDKDACLGDSGGPVLYTDPASGLLFLVGVINYGERCAVKGGVNARVTAHLAWILNNTPGSEYCNR